MNGVRCNEMEHEAMNEADTELDAGHDASGAGSSSKAQPGRMFDVGNDEVLGVVNDPVGLVDCVVMVPWSRNEQQSRGRCVVDAYVSGLALGKGWVARAVPVCVYMYGM